MLRAVFQTKNEMIFPVSGQGSVEMKFCLVNLIEPATKSLLELTASLLLASMMWRNAAGQR